MILKHKYYSEPSVFTAENLLREARRQKGLVPTTVPPVCILDPDGDLGKHLLNTGRAAISKDWACYHTELLTFEEAGLKFGFSCKGPVQCFELLPVTNIRVIFYHGQAFVTMKPVFVRQTRL